MTTKATAHKRPTKRTRTRLSKAANAATTIDGFAHDTDVAGLTYGQFSLFEAYCGQVARLREAQRRVSIEGLVIADPKGNPVPHPAIQIEKQAQAEIRAWGTKFMPRRRVGL